MTGDHHTTKRGIVGVEDYFGQRPVWRELSASEAARFPYSAVCRIEVWRSTNEQLAAGTGWLAGTTTVITAAHVTIFGPPVGAYHVLVRFPSPFFEVWASDLRGHHLFSGHPGSLFDIAALRLPTPASRLALARASRGDPQVEVTGFPIWPGFPFATHVGPVVSAQGGYLLHRAETHDGHSGAPLIATAGDGARVVGLHLGGPVINPFQTLDNVGLALDGEAGSFIAAALQAWS